jgi:hypothetical protein
MSERIQSRAAKSILGIALRSVQSLAAQGKLPSAAQYKRNWTFEEAALRRFVAEQEQATQDRARARSYPVSTTKKAVKSAPSYAAQTAYERALGLKPDRSKHPRRRSAQDAAAKSKKD